MKKIFVFIGDPMTGKSTLARLCIDSNTKILDDIDYGFAQISNLVNNIKKGTIDYIPRQGYREYKNYIIVCHPENSTQLLMELESLKNKFEISIVRFEQL